MNFSRPDEKKICFHSGFRLLFMSAYEDDMEISLLPAGEDVEEGAGAAKWDSVIEQKSPEASAGASSALPASGFSPQLLQVVPSKSFQQVQKCGSVCMVLAAFATIAIISYYFIPRAARDLNIPLLSFSHLEYVDSHRIRMQWLAPASDGSRPLLLCTSQTTGSEVGASFENIGMDGTVTIGINSFDVYHAVWNASGYSSCRATVCILEDCGDWKPIRLSPVTPGITKVGFMSDNHDRPDMLDEFTQSLVDKGVSLIVHGGDCVQNNGRVMQQWAVDFLSGFNPTTAMFPYGRDAVPFAIVRGNHDGEYTLAQLMVWAGGMKNPWRTFKHGHIFFVLLDSNFGQDFQTIFLREALSSQEARDSAYRVVVFHKPPYTNAWPTYAGEEYYREHWVPVFEEMNVNLVLGGHTHYFEAGQQNNVWYVVAGGAGGGLDSGPAAGTLRYPFLSNLYRLHHVLMLEATDQALSCRAFPLGDPHFEQPFFEFQIPNARLPVAA